MTDLTITAHTTAGGVLLELAGELDFHTAPRIRDTLAGLTFTPGQQLIIDLSGLRFCDSSGITAFIAVHNRIRAAGGALALVGVPDRIARAFGIVGLDRFLAIYPTARAAAQAWAAARDQDED